MPLFQNNIINKYLQAQNQTLVAQQWAVYQKHFHNPHVQDNIRGSKEEQYQEGFLTDLFVHILGYTKKPAPNYNLTTELKNVKDSKKADGAIIIDQNVRAVIELKGTNTTDLNKIEAQAFGYKNNQANCTYVITANFEKLRLYIDNAIEHIEFNLFSLTQKEFQLLYLCLAYNNIAQNIPQRIKAESQQAEDQITQQLYRDYSAFKHQLFDNLCQRNPTHDQLVLFKKSQKLLDKFLFLFFAEDRQLLQANSVRSILQQWKSMKNWQYYTPLYDHYKRYFHFLIDGIKNETLEVFPYNGGLFEADEVLDNLLIDDHILYDHTQKLSAYDFGSEVDVNILGHIFENSLNEIDEMTAQLQGQNIDKTQTKRKKDGIFYTPRYITKYIVENTVGKLCTDKKNDLQIIDTNYVADKKRTAKEKKPLLERLDAYRQWLLQITICDPACGSGAFLNEALNFLIHEHRYIDELQAKVFGDAFVLTDVELSILENNLFGVDINDESVEIAKLSLWLRTARPKRKLNTLSNNIKCGNSLISNPNIAGDKAFDWQTAFPKVFERGGFDVVIGNPPYVQIQSIKELSDSLEKQGYQTFEKTGDLYCLFYEKGNQLLKPNGLLGYITSNKWLRANYGKSLRQYILQNTQPLLLVDLGAGIFDSATVDSNILLFQKTTPCTSTTFTALDLSKETNFTDFTAYEHQKLPIQPNRNEPWTIANAAELGIKQKLQQTGIPLKDWDIQINYGIKTGFNDAFIIDQATKDRLCAEDPKSADIIKPILRGRDIQRYCPEWAGLWLINTHNGYKNVARIDVSDYPAIKKYLDQFYPQLLKRLDKGATPYNLRNCAYVDDFDKEKIIYPNMTLYLPFVYDERGFYTNQKCFIITTKTANLKYLLSVLNSKVARKWIRNNCPELQGGTRELSKVFFENIPVPQISLEAQQPFIAHANSMLELHAALSSLTQKVQRSLQREFGLATLNTKLQQWHTLSYASFLGELAKQKIKLTLQQKAEWEEFFVTEQQKAHSLQQQIEQTDRQINAMVYALYGLSDEEIAIVEKN